MAGKKYPEAYALIVYDGPDGQSEVVWNSRDGMAPWQILTRDGSERMETRDDFAGVDPDYIPKPGERVIVDWDPEELRAKDIQDVTEHWKEYASSYKLLHGIKSLEEAIESIRKKSYVGLPRLVTVADSGWPDIIK